MFVFTLRPMCVMTHNHVFDDRPLHTKQPLSLHTRHTCTHTQISKEQLWRSHSPVKTRAYPHDYINPIMLVLWVSDISLWSEQNEPLRLLFEQSLQRPHGCLGPCAMCYISFSDHSLCTITGQNLMTLIPHYNSNDKCAKY